MEAAIEKKDAKIKKLEASKGKFKDVTMAMKLQMDELRADVQKKMTVAPP